MALPIPRNTIKALAKLLDYLLWFGLPVNIEQVNEATIMHILEKGDGVG